MPCFKIISCQILQNWDVTFFVLDTKTLNFICKPSLETSHDTWMFDSFFNHSLLNPFWDQPPTQKFDHILLIKLKLFQCWLHLIEKNGEYVFTFHQHLHHLFYNSLVVQQILDYGGCESIQASQLREVNVLVSWSFCGTWEKLVQDFQHTAMVFLFFTEFFQARKHISHTFTTEFILGFFHHDQLEDRIEELFDIHSSSVFPFLFQVVLKPSFCWNAVASHLENIAHLEWNFT